MGLADKLKPNPFAGDTGEAPAELAAALEIETFAERMEAIVAALSTCRLLVPIMAHAHPGRTKDGGVAAHNKTTQDACEEAAMMGVEAPDGRAAMPVFSSIEAMMAWKKDVRPVPVHTQNAAIAAIAEADSLLVLDPGSPRPMLIGRPAVNALATGETWRSPWNDEELNATVASALAGITHLVGARLQVGQKAETALVIAVDEMASREDLNVALGLASQRLAHVEELTNRIDSLELVPVRAVSNTTN